MTDRALNVKVIAPNLKRRLSGVTATIARLVPLQAADIAICATGPGLPENVPHMSLWRVLLMARAPRRVWHARRNTEMLLGLFLQKVLRKNLALIFTSASQRVHSRYTRWLIGQMDHVIATSAKGQAYLSVPSTVVHHGIDTDVFRPSSDKATLRGSLGLPETATLIGCFGRVRHQKGTDLFVNAMMGCLRTHPNTTAVVLGRATEGHKAFEADLKTRVTAAGLETRILFPGEVPVDQVVRWYQALDLFVAPQRWEGFGLTPLEAMACGVPTVANDVGAFSELIAEGDTGTVLPAPSREALETAVSDLLSGPDRLAAWSSAARARAVDHFQIQHEADALNAVYQSFL